MEAQELETSVNDLEKKIDRLRALYDQYFLGIEKLEPLIPRKDVDRSIRLLRRERIRSTAVRFRFQQQIQRFNTYITYWARICRQIEEGTFKRDMLRAKALMEEKRAKEGKKGRRRKGELPEHDVDLSDLEVIDEEDTDPGMVLPADPFESLGSGTPVPWPGGGQKRRGVAPGGEARGASPTPTPGTSTPGIGGPSESRIKALYRTYVAARRQCGEGTDGLSYESMRRQLSDQAVALSSKHGKDVDFKVVIRNGKAVIRAVPKT